MEETAVAWDLEMNFPPPGYVTYKEGRDYHLKIVMSATIEVP